MFEYALAKPSPVPLSLVVKKGSNNFSLSSSAMPGPVSSMLIILSSALIPTNILPSGCAASPALIRISHRTWWIFWRSTCMYIGPSYPFSITTSRNWPLARNSSISSSISAATSRLSNCKGAGRAKLRKSLNNKLRRSASLTTILIKRRSSGSTLSSSSNNWTDPLIEARGFRISWAKPEARRPTAASRSARINCSSRALNSVRSWNAINKPKLSPLASNIGLTE